MIGRGRTTVADDWQLDVFARRTGYDSFVQLVKAEAHGDDRHLAGLKMAGFESIEDLVAAAEEGARQQALSPPTWTDLEQALTALGSEENIAQRIKMLRQ